MFLIYLSQVRGSLTRYLNIGFFSELVWHWKGYLCLVISSCYGRQFTIHVFTELTPGVCDFILVLLHSTRGMTVVTFVL